MDDEVLHFNYKAHYRSQQRQEYRRQRRKIPGVASGDEGGSMFARFVFVSGTIGLAMFLPAIFASSFPRAKTGAEK